MVVPVILVSGGDTIIYILQYTSCNGISRGDATCNNNGENGWRYFVIFIQLT
jgi:hypothetical protein